MKLFYIACAVAVLGLVKGGIYSSMNQESTVEIIDLDREIGYPIKKLLGNEYNSGSRKKRSSTATNQPAVSLSDLDESRFHNQAVVHWDEESRSSVLILTRELRDNKVTGSTLWRSEDYGQTFNLLTDEFPSDTILESYFPCKADQSKLVFIDGVNNSRKIWVTDNMGETYRQIVIPFSAKKIEIHPDDCNWLLGHDKDTGELYCSLDFGNSWQKLGSNVTDDRFHWYVKDSDTGPDAKKIVYFEQRSSEFVSETNEVYEMKSCYVPDCRETPFQKHLNDLGNVDFDSTIVKDDYVFVQKSGDTTKLFVSYKRGPFYKATFPAERTAQADFHVISTDGECAVVGVNHNDGISHLYFSDLEGKEFKKSLDNVRYFNKRGAAKSVYNVDIHQVQGLIGTYLANVHLRSDETNITKITNDNGKSWRSIVENVNDINDNPMAPGCVNCQLNLHIAMTTTASRYYMPAALSKKSVPGLILALGSYGTYLRDQPSQVSLFVSNDNGKSWSVVTNDRQVALVANHGAIVVAIEMIYLQPTNKFYFSNSYGESGEMFDFTDSNKKVSLDGLLTVPGEESYNITIIAHKDYSSAWKIFTLNLAPLYPRQCNYPEDFRNITLPIEFETPSCPFGYVQTIERLKEGQNCLIPETYKHTTTTSCVRNIIEDTLQKVLEAFFATNA